MQRQSSRCGGEVVGWGRAGAAVELGWLGLMVGVWAGRARAAPTHPPPCHPCPCPAAPKQALPLNKAALAGAWKPPPAAAPPLTVPAEPRLRSDARAEERRRFDAELAAKHAALEAERAELQALQAAAEEEALRAHRRALQHQPLPLSDRL